MHKLKDRIIDYDANKEEADRWLNLKGIAKYEQFADILDENNIEITWKNIDDLVRYDKRLLINIFKYLSFCEDYLRALIWNINKASYNRLERGYLNDVIEEVLENESLLTTKIDFDSLKSGRDAINSLRNRVSHNKIMLNFNSNSLDLKQALIHLRNSLPKDYQNGFINDINNCVKGLNISESVRICV